MRELRRDLASFLNGAPRRGRLIDGAPAAIRNGRTKLSGAFTSPTGQIILSHENESAFVSRTFKMEFRIHSTSSKSVEKNQKLP